MNDVMGAPQRSKRLLLGLGVLVLVLVAFFVGRITSPDPSPKAPESDASERPDPGPTAEMSGVPVGYVRTEEGAVAAAAAFARQMSEVEGDDNNYRQTLLTLAAPQWRSDAEEIAKNTMDFIREQYGDDASAEYSPLRYRIVTCSSSSCTVQVWGVTVVSSPSHQLKESWSTIGLTLEWVNEDWRVAGQSSQPGPTPQLLQEQQGGPGSLLSEFQEFGSAPAP